LSPQRVGVCTGASPTAGFSVSCGVETGSARCVGVGEGGV
jgi:hypothetical protein